MAPKNDTNYSNSSASRLKAGDLESTLSDANKCIALNQENHKGYGRKGAAYFAMKKYDRAIATYKEGIKVCGSEEHLQKGLETAKKAKMKCIGASQAVMKTEVVQMANMKKSPR
jgi:stress-induced-phosphoprotein 1